MSAASIPDSPWLNVTPARGARRLRLFCLPFAGGGTVAYHPWTAQLGEGVELIRVQLPGREVRLREAPFRRLPPLVEALGPQVAPHCAEPFAFYGHSMGALLAFELVRWLRRHAHQPPRRLFVSAFRAPHLPDPEPPRAGLSQEAFVGQMRPYNGIPRAILEDEELMAIFLPVLRADFEMVESYVHRPEPPLACPITALGGLADFKVAPESLRAWEGHTLADFELRFFPGGHFFPMENGSQVLAYVQRRLADAPGRAPDD